MKTLALVWGTHISSNRNTTRFQRAACLADQYNCVFYTWTSGTIPDRVAISEQSVYICPGGPVFSRLIFPFWILYHIVFSRKTKFDAVHTSYHLLSIFTGFWCSVAGKVWIMDIWDHPRLPLESKRGLLLLFYRLAYLLAMRCMRRADLIVLSLHPEFARKHELPKEKIVTVTNGTELSLYQNITSHNGENFNIVYVGFLMKERGIDTVIDAIVNIQMEMPQSTVTLIGPMTPEDEQWLQQRIQEEEISEMINVLGELSHKETLKEITTADVCLFPFPRKQVLEYIFPIKIFEYMALGKAIVSSDLKGAHQILQHGETAILVEPSNPKALAEAIHQLYDNEKFRSKIGQQARQAAKQYDWSKINRKVITAIDAYLASSN